MIRERCEGVHCVDLGESFLNLLIETDSYSNEYFLGKSGQVHLSCARIPGFPLVSERDQTYLLASIQPRTSSPKFVTQYMYMTRGPYLEPSDQ